MTERIVRAGASLKDFIVCKRKSVTAVLIRRSDDDVHPNPHGYSVGSNQKEKTVVRLHTERQSWPGRRRGCPEMVIINFFYGLKVDDPL